MQDTALIAEKILKRKENMRIKLFILASLIYILLLSIFTFKLNLGNYTLSLGANAFDLPVVLWLILPVLIFFIFTLLHMSFYSFLKYINFKNFSKDAQKFAIFIEDLLLEKDSKIKFKTKEFQNSAELVISLKKAQKAQNFAKINEILDILEKLHKGEYLDLKKFKLNQDNPLSILNEKNLISTDIHYAFNKIKGKDESKNDLDVLAFNCLLEKGEYAQIKTIKIQKNSGQIINLIKRFKAGNLDLNAAEFEVLLSHSNLNEKEYLEVAKMSVKLLNPDAILGIFTKIKNEKNEALRAHLYLLAEFGLMEDLREQIKDEAKFSDFKAFLILREKNIKIDLNQLIQ